MEALPIYKFHPGKTPDADNLNRLAVTVLKLVDEVNALKDAQPERKAPAGKQTAAK